MRWLPLLPSHSFLSERHSVHGGIPRRSVRLADMLGQKLKHQRRYFIDLLIECEMTRVELVNLGVGNVALVGFAAGRDE